MAKDQFWTDARVKRLRDLWTKGKSASEIAGAIGGLSRNAVIGKAHRLGLSGRVSPIRDGEAKKPKAKSAAKARPVLKVRPAVKGKVVAKAKAAPKKPIAKKPVPKAKPVAKKSAPKAKPITKKPAPKAKPVVKKPASRAVPPKGKAKPAAKPEPAKKQPPVKKPVKAPAPAPKAAPAPRAALKKAPESPAKGDGKKPQAPKPAPAGKAEKPGGKAPSRTARKGKAKKISILDLNERMCRWPFGDPKSSDFCFCGNPTLEGLPYCAEHATVAYQTMQPGGGRKK